MSTENSYGRRVVVRRAGSICAAWLIAAAGAGQALGQDRNPFGTKGASKAEVTVSEYLTVDLHVQDEDLANVLQMLSLQSQRNIVVSKDVSATVSANLYNVTFYEALDAILHVNGYGYIERGNFIFVYTLQEIDEIERATRKPVQKVVRLNYLNANDAAEFVSPLLSEVGQIKTNGDPGAFTMTDKSPIGDESYALSSMVVIFDYPEHVEEIEKLIASLDTRPAQVLVEATILQTQLNEANAFGVDFSIIGDVNFTDFMDIGGPLSTVNNLISGGSGDSGFSPADNRAQSAVSRPGNTSGPSTFKAGIIRNDFSVFMRLLDEVTDVTILSRPKILTLNRQPARVLVGQRVGYLNTTSTETSTTQTVEFLDTGTQLSFRPFISNDGMIRMELSPSVSEAVIREATEVSGSNVSIPDEITQSLTTNVLVRDGSTIVLGGLFKETTTLGRRQVPFIGDIPIIGAAFRGHDDMTARSEIIFLITPTIVNDQMLLDQGDRALAHAERVRTGVRSGLLPWSRDRMTAMLNVEAERLALEGNSGEAFWKIRRSLSLNPAQPEAIELRERLMNKREIWPNRSLLQRILDDEIDASYDNIEPVGLMTHPLGQHLVAVPLDQIDERMMFAEAAKQQPVHEGRRPQPPTARFADDQATTTSAGDTDRVRKSDNRKVAIESERGPTRRMNDADDLKLTVTITPSLTGEELFGPEPEGVDGPLSPIAVWPEGDEPWNVERKGFVDDPFSDMTDFPTLTDQSPAPAKVDDWAMPFWMGDPGVLVMQEPEAPEMKTGDMRPLNLTFTGVWRNLQPIFTGGADQTPAVTHVEDDGFDK